MASSFSWIVRSHKKGIEHSFIWCFWVRHHSNSRESILFWKKKYIKWSETAQLINLPCSFWKLVWLNHRLNLWASGMLFFIFANIWVENTFGRNFLPKSTQSISQGIKAASSEQIYSSYALKHTVIAEAYTHFTSNLSLFFHAWIVKDNFPSWVLTNSQHQL